MAKGTVPAAARGAGGSVAGAVIAPVAPLAAALDDKQPACLTGNCLKLQRRCIARSATTVASLRLQ